MCFTVLEHLTPNTCVLAALESCWAVYCGVSNSSVQFYANAQISELQGQNVFPVPQMQLFVLNTMQDKT